MMGPEKDVGARVSSPAAMSNEASGVKSIDASASAGIAAGGDTRAPSSLSTIQPGADGALRRTH